MHRNVSEIQRLIDSYKTGERTPEEVVQEVLLYAENSQFVFINISRDRANFEADQATQRYRAGYPLGPLDGVPIAWKDNIDLKGTPTTGGTKVLGDQVATEDATAVRTLARNGMVSVGKTNLSELAYSGLGLNPHYGTPEAVSPGNKAPGGSSSGSAIAVASGIVPVAMGSDTAGSLRIPAAFNGLYAFRPSVSRHSLSGVMPLAPTMDTIGFMARTAEDVIRADEALVGQDSPHFPAEMLSEISLVVDPDWLAGENIAPGVQEAFTRTVVRLRDLGVTLTERCIPSLKKFYSALAEGGWLGSFEATFTYRELLSRFGRTNFDPRVYDRMFSVSEQRFDRLMSLLNLRQELISRLPEELGKSFLLMPTVAHPAPDLEPLERDTEYFARVNLSTLRLTMFGSFLDTPAFTLPVGRDTNGQHLAVQWLAPQGQDDRLLRAVRALPANILENQ